MPTTRELAAHLLSTAPDHEGWSVVESPNSFGYLEDLLAWAEELDWMTWNTDRNIRRRELGLVLLWLESEIARRRGGEGSLWPILSNQELIPWLYEVYTELFTFEGNATQLHRDLLQGAADYYGLRNTFNDDHGQNWYRLIYLQFGFTHDDAVNRLAQWLSGHGLPVSIERLLGGNDSGALQFQNLWRSLRMFRLGNLNSETMDSRFRVNPWVLPEWTTELKKAALASSAQSILTEDLEVAELRFVTTPKLTWSEGRAPAFTTSLCNLSGFDLVDPTYFLKIEDVVFARLIRQPDGTYYSDSPEEISLPVKPELPVSLVSQHGSIIAHDLLKLWDLDEEASLYTAKTGNQFLSDDRLRAGTAVYLIVSQDVSVDPLPYEIWDLGLGYSLLRIPPGWTRPIKVSLDDDVLWSSLSTQAQAGLKPVGITAHFTATLDLREGFYANEPPPWYLPIRISIPHRYRLERFRWRRGDGLLIERNELPPALSLTETDAVKPLVLRIQVSSNGRKQTEVVKVPVPFVAALKWLKTGEVYHHQPNRKLLLGEARSQAWSFSLPPENGNPRDPRQYSYLEGGVIHGRLKQRPSALPDFVGLGAPLKVIEDKFNVIESVMDISPCVLDGGLLGSVQWLEEEDAFFIKSRFLEFGEWHEFRAFSRDSNGTLKIETVPWDNLERVEDGLFWHSWGGVSLYALSLFYQENCLGSWFDFESWSSAVTQNESIPATEAARMVMEWKAPVLQEDGNHKQRISHWFLENWVKVLPVWLQDSQFKQNRKWGAAVNEILLKSLPKPDADTADQIVEALKDPETNGVYAEWH